MYDRRRMVCGRGRPQPQNKAQVNTCPASQNRSDTPNAHPAGTNTPSVANPHPHRPPVVASQKMLRGALGYTRARKRSWNKQHSKVPNEPNQTVMRCHQAQHLTCNSHTLSHSAVMLLMPGMWYHTRLQGQLRAGTRPSSLHFGAHSHQGLCRRCASECLAAD